MKHFYQRVEKIIAGAMIVFFVSFYSLPALAAGTTGPTGPVGPIGPTGPTGTIAPTGPVVLETQTSSTTDSSVNGTGTDINQSNSSTGANSENSNSTASGSETNVNVNNNANVQNNINLDMVTGGNDIGSNTVVGNITTGNINSNVNVINALNSVLGPNDTVGSQSVNTLGMNGITLTPSDTRLNLQNATTGYGSDNTNVFDGGKVVNVLEVNNANADNNITVNADSGDNNISNNTQVGELQTGDICISANLINLLNIAPEVALSIDFWNLMGGFAGDIVVNDNNSTTGVNSGNNNSIDLSNTSNVNIANNSNTNNDLSINTETGNNTLGSNTSVGDISTGDSKIKSTLVNVANLIATPVFYIVNVFGQWTGGSLLGVDSSNVFVNQINDTTGANSENSNQANIDNSTNVSLENNANINNELSINANTGNNKISNNTVIGNIKTGDISIAANVINISNLVGKGAKTFALRIINIFGGWSGGCKDTCNGDGKGGGGGETPGGGEVIPPVVVPPIVLKDVMPVGKVVATNQIAEAKSPLRALPAAGMGNLSNNSSVILTQAKGRNLADYLIWIIAATTFLTAMGTVGYLSHKKVRS